LDEDYYFKLLDQLYQQQLSDAMLLFDEINQKGFETDTLLEGFAEFIRNLLVSKDAKVIKLLDVAEDFKSKYLQFASSVDLGWLLSALNLINDTSISFKQAKNKKLHVELLLIKLSYLQQAISISINDNTLIKKKIVDQSKAIAFKALPSIKLAEQNISINNAVKKQENAVLIIEQKENEEKISKTENLNVNPIVEKTNVKFGSLSKIRAGISNQLNHNIEKKKLTSDSLFEFWKSYIAKLNNENNHSAATNFQFASLNIKDEHHFEIITESNIQQKFIEAERSSLIEQLHIYFNDNSLKYQILLIEKIEETSTSDRPMNSKEHFKLLCESYPLIQDLKEKLKLTLEF
jgi:DNA polymerase-3 subunit gamma/tau